MMKKIKSHKLILIFTLLFGISCTDEFLTKNPEGVVFEENLANPDGIESLLIGAYSNLDLWWGNHWIFSDVYTDDAYKGSTLHDLYLITELETYRQRPNDDYVIHDTWKTIFDAISRCNDVLRISKVALDNKKISVQEYTQYVAEARFLRGHFHLEAIKIWDFIPYIDERDEYREGFVPNFPDSIPQDNEGNRPWGELGNSGYIPWQEVETDLVYASENLSYPPREVGRAHLFAALGLLGKSKLFQNQYPDARVLFYEIINSAQFDLERDFHNNFRVRGDNNKESIFQYQASIGDFNLSPNANIGESMNFPIDIDWNPNTYPVPGGCCGFYQPSQNLVNAFKTQNGLPYLNTFGLNFNAKGDDVKNDYGVGTNEPFVTDDRPLDPRLDYTVGRRGVPYLDWGDHPGQIWIRDQQNGGPYSPVKHVYSRSEEGDSLGGNQYHGWVSQLWAPGISANNFSILRYADVLLMTAECEIELGNLDKARELVNEVRSRAKNGSWVLTGGALDDGLHIGPNGELPAANYQIEPYPMGGELDPFQTNEGAMEALMFERRLEFGMECVRFWDLKRWGIAKSTLNAYIDKEKELRQYLNNAAFKDHNIRHPIPQVEIDNMRGLLKQNPGY